MATKVTASSTAGVGLGDIVAVTTTKPDKRLWPRVKARLLFRPPPVVRVETLFVVQEVVSSTELEISPFGEY